MPVRNTAERLRALREGRNLEEVRAMGKASAKRSKSDAEKAADLRRKAAGGYKPPPIIGNNLDESLRKAGPLTRFGEGDGSWWDRWLTSEPPKASSYGRGFIRPVNGFKLMVTMERNGKWVPAGGGEEGEEEGPPKPKPHTASELRAARRRFRREVLSVHDAPGSDRASRGQSAGYPPVMSRTGSRRSVGRSSRGSGLGQHAGGGYDSEDEDDATGRRGGRKVGRSIARGGDRGDSSDGGGSSGSEDGGGQRTTRSDDLDSMGIGPRKVPQGLGSEYDNSSESEDGDGRRGSLLVDEKTLIGLRSRTRGTAGRTSSLPAVVVDPDAQPGELMDAEGAESAGAASARAADMARRGSLGNAGRSATFTVGADGAQKAEPAAEPGTGGHTRGLQKTKTAYGVAGVMRRPPGWRDEAESPAFASGEDAFGGRRRSIAIGDRYPDAAMGRRFSFLNESFAGLPSDSDSSMDSEDIDEEIAAAEELAQATFAGRGARWNLYKRYHEVAKDEQQSMMSTMDGGHRIRVGEVDPELALIQIEAATQSPRSPWEAPAIGIGVAGAGEGSGTESATGTSARGGGPTLDPEARKMLKGKRLGGKKLGGGGGFGGGGLKSLKGGATPPTEARTPTSGITVHMPTKTGGVLEFAAPRRRYGSPLTQPLRIPPERKPFIDFGPDGKATPVVLSPASSEQSGSDSEGSEIDEATVKATVDAVETLTDIGKKDAKPAKKKGKKKGGRKKKGKRRKSMAAVIPPNTSERAKEALLRAHEIKKLEDKEFERRERMRAQIKPEPHVFARPAMGSPEVRAKTAALAAQRGISSPLPPPLQLPSRKRGAGATADGGGPGTPGATPAMQWGQFEQGTPLSATAPGALNVGALQLPPGSPLTQGLAGGGSPGTPAGATAPFAAAFTGPDSDEEGSPPMGSARRRYLAYCQEQALAPEPLIIAKSDYTVLRLGHYSMGGDKAKALARGLSAMPKLHHLDLRNNRLEEKGALNSVLKALTTTATRLETLDLSENKLNLNAAMAVGALLKSTETLTQLHLSSCHLGDAEVAHIAEGVRVNKTLTRLTLDHNNIGGRSGPKLADMIEAHDSLMSLDLSWNVLRGPEATSLGVALQTNTSLKTLNLAWNGLNGLAAQEVGNALAMNDTLRVLDLSQNGIQGESAFVIASGLMKNTTLNTIQMAGNPVGAAGCKALLRTINLTGDVRNVGLEGCRMEDSVPPPFNAAHPAGMYKLNLSDRVDRTVMEEILRVAKYQPGVTIASLVVMQGTQSRTINLVREELKEAVLVTPGTSRPGTRGTQGGGGLGDDDGEPSDDDDSVRTDELTDSDEEDRRLQEAAQIAIEDVPEDDDVDAPEVVLRDGEGGDDWVIPEEGWADVQVTFRPQPVQKWQKLKSHGMNALVTTMKRKSFDKQDRKSLLNIASSDLYFSAAQASNLLSAYSSTDSREKVDSVFQLLPRLTDPENEATFIAATLNAKERRMLESKLGQLTTFRMENPTGHYRLDLGNDTDKMLLSKLLIINGEESLTARRAGWGDTSQHGTWDNFRNATINGEDYVLDGEFRVDLATGGVLEFDYVSTTVAPPFARAWRRRDFAKFKRKFNKIITTDLIVADPADVVAAGKPTGAAAQADGGGAEGEAVDATGTDDAAAAEARTAGAATGAQDGLGTGMAMEAHVGGGGRRRSSAAAMLTVVSPTQMTKALEALREAVSMTWVKTEQAVTIIEAIPMAQPGFKVEAIIAMFGRMQKVEDVKDVLLPLLSESAREDVWTRIGWLNLFNPMDPDGFLDIQLEVREQRAIAVMLVDLAIAEPGENWEGETFEDIAGWELPASWIEEVPHAGHLTLTYTSTSAGCAPDWDARRRLVKDVLAGRKRVYN